MYYYELECIVCNVYLLKFDELVRQSEHIYIYIYIYIYIPVIIVDFPYDPIMSTSLTNQFAKRQSNKW